jgi:hypothetical protein
VCEAATGLVGCRWIDRGIADLDKLDFPVFTHHKSGAVAHAIRTQDAIGFGCFAIFEIAQQGDFQFELVGENFLGGNVIGADAKNEGAVGLEFCDTSLVCGEFLRSATGKCGGKE